MKPILIDGKKIAAEVRAEVKLEIESLAIKPKLVVIRVGNDSASGVYVRNKVKACEEVGITSQVIELPEDTNGSDLIHIIRRFNRDEETHGILVQLPLPKHISVEEVNNTIDWRKDVDCFNLYNVGKFYTGKPYTKPCTPAGVMELLKRYNIELEGKKVLVIGRSDIVGKPMAQMLTNANCTVTVCHSKTPPSSLAELIYNTDIIVSAVGIAGVVEGYMFGHGQVVVDVGMNRDENGKLCGDVNLGVYEERVGMITPVPGGVGPMTIAMLLKNCIKCAKELI